MRNLTDMIAIETRKALRSRVPLLTAGLFLLMPLASVFMMLIFKDPEAAQQMGLISMKANLVGGTADWPSFIGILAQGVGIAGIFLFSLIVSWIFGREFADGTVKDFLAVPTPRGTILLAKFIVSALWGLFLTVFVYAVGVALASLLGLDGGSTALLVRGGLMLTITGLMVVASAFPVALFASVGRGYLLPLGIVFILLILSQVMGAIGYGSYFPWSIPALYAGISGETLGPISYWIIAITGLLGIASTQVWWRYADQAY